MMHAYFKTIKSFYCNSKSLVATVT